MHGQFVWYDLVTPDGPAARDFYTRVCGWSLEPFGGSPDYVMFKAPPRAIGGVETREGPSHWLGYVDVDDVDAVAARVQEVGGALVREPWSVSEVGRMALVADPGGAVFALYHGSDEPWDPGEPQVGLVTWHELATPDLDAALAFYGALLGWSEVERMDMGPERGFYSIFSDGTRRTGGMWAAPEDVPRGWMFYVQVADLGASLTAARELGGEVTQEPHEVPGGDLIAHLRDPRGADFALVYTPS